MLIEQVDANNRYQVRKFLKVPHLIYRDCPQWVPPISGDEKMMLNRRKYPFYQEGEAAFFLLSSDSGDPLGRIAVLDNERYNQHNQTNIAFFYLFEVVNEIEGARMLFEAAFDWAREHGRTEILGPKGFTALNGLGMLTKGFEHRPALGIPYNHAYYPEFVESIGFTVCRNIVSGHMTGDQSIPEKIHLAAEKVKEKRGLRVDSFQSRKDMRKMLPFLKGLYNGSLVGTSGNAPLTDDEVNTMAKQILWFADPRLIKILFKGEKPVGFLLAYPDISSAIQEIEGNLWPFGWIKVMKELRETEWININGAGIIDEYRGMGGTAILFSEMEKSVKQGGFKHADLVQVGVENERMQRELSSLGIDFYKTHRIYQRTL